MMNSQMNLMMNKYYRSNHKQRLYHKCLLKYLQCNQLDMQKDIHFSINTFHLYSQNMSFSFHFDNFYNLNNKNHNYCFMNFRNKCQDNLLNIFLKTKISPIYSLNKQKYSIKNKFYSLNHSYQHSFHKYYQMNYQMYLLDNY